MLKVVGLIVAAVAAFGQLPIADKALAQGIDGDWELLGCFDVGRRSDRDIIELDRHDGRFEKLRLRALGNDIAIEDLKVVYGNGQGDDIRVRAVLPEEAQTRPLDLEGRSRFIDRIELITRRDFKGRGRGKAVLCVYGEEARSRDIPAGRRGGRVSLQELGCVRVGFSKDSDIVQVGRREGRFAAIRLAARGNDVRIENLRVIYANGNPDELRVGRRLRAGDETDWLDLQGRGRRIERVELITKQDPKGIVKGVIKNLAQGRGPVGPASICVIGLEDDGGDNRRR